MNECDNCKQDEYSDRLIWITAEDFEPLAGEVVPEWAYKQYDALCDGCYYKLINNELTEVKL